MRRRLAVVGLLSLAVHPARAADAPPAPPPAAPGPRPPPAPSSEQAAGEVLTAFATKDEAALKALASRDVPDPWLVADDLIRRERHDVAAAFARAGPRVDTEALPAYVASRRGTPDDPARRARLRSSGAALAAHKPQEALSSLDAVAATVTSDVVGLRLAFARGAALAALGRQDEASATYLAMAEAAERLGWYARAAGTFREAGLAAYRGSGFMAARVAFERALALYERRGDREGAARTAGNLGGAHRMLGDYPSALSMLNRAHTELEALGDDAGAARILANIGNVHNAKGDFAAAIATYERALTAMEALRDAVGIAAALGNLGSVYEALGEHVRALAMLERALAAKEALGDVAAAAETLGNIGNVHYAVGEYARAIATHERALAAKLMVGDRAGAAHTQGNIGVVRHAIGDYAAAILTYEHALMTQEALGDRAGAAATLGNLGLVYADVGEDAKALALYERALREQEAMGDKASAAMTLGNIGLLHDARRDYVAAIATHERALAAKQAIGDAAGVALTLGNLGVSHLSAGDRMKALGVLERALAGAEAVGDRAGVAATSANLGLVYDELGDHGRAFECLNRALSIQEDLGDKAGAVRTLGAVGAMHAALGRFSEAAVLARRAVRMVSLMAGGLGAEEGAGVRAPVSLAYDVGADAAVAVNDASELAFFLESGRAGALLEGLRARETLRSVAVPEDLRRTEATARAAEGAATTALRVALDRGDRATIRARREELDAATERVSAVIARIQREAKAGAALVYPEVASLTALQSTLVEGDALVLYALQEEHATALVVTKGDARIAPLGTTSAVEAAVAALALADATVDATPALAALRALVVDPLALMATTKRLLLSPAGALAYVPFAALAPDRTVAYVPSGTTYGLLREEENSRGDGVLALGDPEYSTKVDERALALHRGATGRLPRLPATRAEVNAVGTVTLLGAEATERGFETALGARPRWRAVHLACHGLVDPERPARSSLAITAAGDDDGFLSCLDVFRLRIPADLVVLSACETGKGKIVKGEGIVGLTRAFMFAGSPRVICSLWKVDDEATRALMTKFYELWNPRAQPEDPERAKRVEGAPGPGLPPAEALRQAQAFVRGHEKWKHPYYWAAWVLWGLPS